MITLLVVPSGDYNNRLFTELKRRRISSACYITLNKGRDALVDFFRRRRISPRKFFFVDCITKTILEPPERDDTIYISSPRALTELSLALTKIIDAVKIKNAVGQNSLIKKSSLFNDLIIDSLSTLAVYESIPTITHFAHSLINRVREKRKMSLILIISDKDHKSGLFKDVELLVDDVTFVRSKV